MMSDYVKKNVKPTEDEKKIETPKKVEKTEKPVKKAPAKVCVF